MNKADKAESLFRTGYNCSQSVYAAFAEELGITVEEAAKKASPFGAGFGKLREVCGAVTGMVMVIGDLYGYDDPKDAAGKKQLYVLVQKLCGSFEASEGNECYRADMLDFFIGDMYKVEVDIKVLYLKIKDYFSGILINCNSPITTQDNA